MPWPPPAAPEAVCGKEKWGRPTQAGAAEARAAAARMLPAGPLSRSGGMRLRRPGELTSRMDGGYGVQIKKPDLRRQKVRQGEGRAPSRHPPLLTV